MKSLNAIHIWGQKVNIGAAAVDHGGIPSHQVERNFLHQVVFVLFKICHCLTRPSQRAGLEERKYTPADTAWPQ